MGEKRNSRLWTTVHWVASVYGLNLGNNMEWKAYLSSFNNLFSSLAGSKQRVSLKSVFNHFHGSLQHLLAMSIFSFLPLVEILTESTSTVRQIWGLVFCTSVCLSPASGDFALPVASDWCLACGGRCWFL